MIKIPFKRKVITTGKSFFICIPPPWIRANNLENGNLVNYSVQENKVNITLYNGGENKRIVTKYGTSSAFFLPIEWIKKYQIKPKDVLKVNIMPDSSLEIER